MPTFMMSLNWTDQGIRAVKDSPKRSEAARELAKKWASKSSIFISRQATAILSSSSMRRAATMSLNSRWLLAHWVTCAPAPSVHGQQTNIESLSQSCPEQRRLMQLSDRSVRSSPIYPSAHRAVPVPDQEFLESVFAASVATFVAASPRLFACSPNALNCISINSV
jgi:hypothetical protein